MARRKSIPSQRSLPQFGYWEYYRELDFLNPTSSEILLDIGRACGLDLSSRVLDVGSGKGTVAILWAQEFGCHVVGVDNLPRMVLDARNRALECELNTRVMFRIMNGSDIDSSFGQSFDVVCCFGSLLIWGMEEGLQRLVRLVAPGGMLAFSDLVFTEQPVDPQFLRRAGYSPDEFPTLDQLRQILHMIGWEIVQIWEAGDEEWQYYLEGTGKALEWYNSMHPGIVNPFVEAEKEWAASLKETNRQWIQFVHVVARERR